ncbi:MAG TPA: DUF3280 domain-containing protein [Steroidobacteraceae bacterium]
MKRGIHFSTRIRAELLLLLLFGIAGTLANAATPSVAVLDIELTGDLGGPELSPEHQARISKESAYMRAELAATGQYRIVDTGPAEALVGRLKTEYLYLHDCNGCDLQIARALGADEILISWVNRVSALILTLTYEIHEASTGRIVARKSYDFRGDNDAAWTHAIGFMIRHLKDDSGDAPDSSTP